MNKEYNTPELFMIKLNISSDVLTLSSPEHTDPGGGAGQSNPNEDPFGLLP